MEPKEAENKVNKVHFILSIFRTFAHEDFQNTLLGGVGPVLRRIFKTSQIEFPIAPGGLLFQQTFQEGPKEHKIERIFITRIGHNQYGRSVLGSSPDSKGLQMIPCHLRYRGELSYEGAGEDIAKGFWIYLSVHLYPFWL